MGEDEEMNSRVRKERERGEKSEEKVVVKKAWQLQWHLGGRGTYLVGTAPLWDDL